MDALKALLLKDKAWVKAALSHLRNMVFGAAAGGRVPDSAVGVGIGGNDQRRRLFGFDLGKSVGLELAPTVQMLAELLLCSQGEEVNRSRSGESAWIKCVLGALALRNTHVGVFFLCLFFRTCFFFFVLGRECMRACCYFTKRGWCRRVVCGAARVAAVERSGVRYVRG